MTDVPFIPPPGDELPPLAQVFHYAPVPPPSNSRPRVWTVFVTYIVALAAMVLAQVVFGGVLMVSAMRQSGAASFEELQQRLVAQMLQPKILFPMLVMNQLVIGAAALSSARLSRTPLIDRLRLRRSNNSWFMLILMGLSILCLQGLLAVAYSTIDRIHPLPRSQTLEPLNKAMSSLRGGMLVLAVVVIGILPAIFEEMLCRGYIATRLRQRWGVASAIVISSLLFAILHMDLVQSVLVFFLGLYLGYVAERSGSIRASMFCHAFNNSAAVLAAVLFSVAAHGQPSPSQPEDLPIGSALIVMAVFAALFLLMNWWLHYGFRKHPPIAIPVYVPPPVYPPLVSFEHQFLAPPPLPIEGHGAEPAHTSDL